MQGSSTVQADPDQAILNAKVSANGRTTEQAVNSLSKLSNQIIDILESNGITKDNYKTTSFRTYPNTSWTNGVSTVINQVA